MKPELIITILLGMLEVFEQLARIMERFGGQVSEETQEEVRKTIDRIRSGDFFRSDAWHPKA